jgi:hypothetical protein
MSHVIRNHHVGALFALTTKVHSHCVESIKQILCFDPNWSAASICAQVAKLFGVTQAEVGLLQLQENWLRFLHPAQLSSAGDIHLTSSAIAAQTTQTGKAELFNNFMRVSHLSVFELIKLNEESCNEPIQKLISAPILNPQGRTWGVLQVSRKAPNLESAGPDFTPEDLGKLQLIAASIGRSVASSGVSTSLQSESGASKHVRLFPPLISKRSNP